MVLEISGTGVLEISGTGVPEMFSNVHGKRLFDRALQIIVSAAAAQAAACQPFYFLRK